MVKEKKERKEMGMEEELRKYRLIVESAQDAIFVKDLDSHYLLVNQKCLEAFGKSKQEEVLGKRDDELLPPEQAKINIEDDQEVFKTGRPKEVTKKMTAGGKERWFQAKKVPLRDAQGKIIGLISIARDITERKKAEEARQESEEKLNAMLQSIGDHISMMDKDLNIIWVNETAKKNLSNDIIGKKCYEVAHQRKKPCEPCITLKAFQDGKIHEHDIQVIDKDGKTKYLHSTANVALRDKEGNPTAVIEISRNITEQKKVEEALRESEQKFRTIFDNAIDGILVADVENKKFYTGNKMMCQMLGYSLEEIKNLGVMDIHPKENLPYVIKEFEKQVREKSTLVTDIPVKRKDGSVFYVDVNSAPITLAGKTYLLGIFRDLTERKRMEKSLIKLNNCFLKFGLDSTKNIDIIVNTTGTILGGVCALYNRLKGDLLYTKSDWQAPADMAREDKAKGHLCFDVISANKNEPLIVSKLDASPYAESDPNVKKYNLKTYIGHVVKIKDKPVGSLCVVYQEDKEFKPNEIDVISILAKALGIEEEREKTEEVVRKSEDKYRILVENLPQKIFLKDKNSVYISCNENYARDLKIKSGEIVGKTDYEFYPKELAEKYRADDKRIMESGETEDIEERYIQQGQEVIVHTVKTPVKDEEGNIIGLLGIFWDITERKKAGEELRFKTTLLEAQSETSIDGILVVDSEGKSILFNRQFGQMWKIPQRLLKIRDDERMLQCVVTQLKYPDKFLEKVKYLYARREKKSRDEIEFKDGRTFDRYSSPLTDSKGKYYGRIWYFRDITEHKKTEEKIRVYAQAIEGAYDAFVITERDWKIIFANHSVLDMSGYRRDELMTKHVSIFSPKSELKKQKEALREAETRGSWSGELINKRKNGEEFPIILSLSLIKNEKNEVVGALSIFRDIAETKKLISDLKKTKVELTAKIEDLERFERVTVDRELKMIELKKKVKELKEKLR